MDKNEQLIERNKELNCLYEIDKIGFVTKNLDEYIKEIIKIIQNGFQYVSFLKVHIEYNNQSYKSPYFQKTKHFLKENLSFKNEIIGSITVYYASEKLKSSEPFLKEEERLLFSIARRISDYLYYYEKEKTYKTEGASCNEIICNTQSRLNLVSDLCSKINLNQLGIIAVYLIGSTKNHTAAKKSDIDLIIHYDGKRSSKNNTISWLRGWESCKKEEISKIFDGNESSIFDLHFITDKDIEEKSSYATMITSHNNSAKLLKKK